MGAVASGVSASAVYNNVEPYKPRYQKAESNNPTYSNLSTYANIVGNGHIQTLFLQILQIIEQKCCLYLDSNTKTKIINQFYLH